MPFIRPLPALVLALGLVAVLNAGAPRPSRMRSAPALRRSSRNI
jgi:hypothetical protein